jgi:hypothetical protein
MSKPSNSIPLMFDEDTSISDLGREFDHVINQNNDRGLINPLVRDSTHRQRTTPSMSRQDILTKSLNNNFDPSEELYMTRRTAMNNLIMAANKPRIPGQYVDHETQLDPRIDEALRQEASLNRSNIFSTQSQDFVDEVRAGIQGYAEEQNLYFGSPSVKQPSEQLLQGLTDLNQDGVVDHMDLMFSMGEHVVKAQEKKRQEKIKEDTARADIRAQEVPTVKPTTIPQGTEPHGVSVPQEQPRVVEAPPQGKPPQRKPEPPQGKAIPVPDFFDTFNLSSNHRKVLMGFFEHVRSGKRDISDLNKVKGLKGKPKLRRAIQKYAARFL